MTTYFNGETELADMVADVISSHPEILTKRHDIEEIYGEEVIVAWVKKSKYVNDVFSDKEISEYAKKTLNPDDVFSKRDLEAWAEENGYVKE